ncbi:hypothetical protein [Nocardioides jejuensis]|nr:hypothetical protein [Nocardioides jejuensis]
MNDLTRRVLSWYAEHQRDLPWRRPGTTAWSVMVAPFRAAPGVCQV